MPGHFARQSRSLRDFSKASISPFSGVSLEALGSRPGSERENFPVASHFSGCRRRGQRKDEEKMAEKDLKRKFALWIRPSLLEEVDSLYQKDNCASRSEFMEKALQFYIGYLACSHAQDYLAQVIPSTVKGIMDETANRMGRLMFKMAVEQAVTENILAAVCSVDQQDVTRLRGQCIEEIRKTNGLLSFDKALSWQKDE